MVHSYTKILVHLIWTTKNRQRILTRDARLLVQKHIAEYARERNIRLEALNAQAEHVHALLSLLSNQKIDEILKFLKGESSHWINDRNLIAPKFSWQRGYGAFSVSPSHYERVKLYINNQDEHHRKRTFLEEYKTILRKYGFSLAETDESVQV